MKPRHLIVIALVVATSSQAQIVREGAVAEKRTQATAPAPQRAPTPNPPVGGLGRPGDLISGGDIRAGRRAVMRETVERQYTPAEIREYRKIVDGYDRSKSGVYQEASRLVRRQVDVGLRPDSLVQEIRLNAENVGSIVFSDSMGNPWPVVDVVVPSYLIAQKQENMIVLRPSAEASAGKRFNRGSITVLLDGLKSTVPFALAYGMSKEVDAQVDARVQGRNPKAIVSGVHGSYIEADEDAERFLDGQAPREARALNTSARGVKAWLYRGRLYVRTQMSLHSPAYNVYATSPVGMSIYRFDTVPHVINAIADGQIVAINIGE